MLARIRALVAAYRLPVFPDFNSASAQCVGDSYEAGDLVAVVAEKTRRFARLLGTEGAMAVAVDPSSSAVGIAAANSERKRLRVLDVGGACGAHFYAARALLPAISLDWTVVETPAMVAAAERAGLNELRFTSTIPEGEQFDLVHTSGTLQCVPDAPGLARTLVALKAPWLFLGRIGWVEGRAIATIHHSTLGANGVGPLPEGFTDRTVRYAFSFPNRQEVEDTWRGTYHTAASWQDHSGVFRVRGVRPQGAALLLKRSAA